MELTDQEKHNKYPEIQLDLEEIKTKSKFSYDYLLKKRPGVIPVSAFVQELAESESKYASVAKILSVKSHDLLTINPIYVPLRLQGIPDNEFEKECIASTTQDLSNMGVEVSEQNILSSLEEDGVFVEIRKKHFREPLDKGIMEIVSHMQQEYAQIAYSARIYEIAKQIAKKYAPKVTWYSDDSAYIYNISESDRKYNGNYNSDSEGVNLLRVQGTFDDIGYTMRVLSGSTALVEEYLDDKVLTAFHESGHAAHFELYPLEVRNRSKVPKNDSEANLLRCISEGYAYEYELLGDEILNVIVPELPENFNFGPLAISDRAEFFEQSGLPVRAKEYTDGQIVIQKLKEQLGVVNKSREDQIVEISQFLSRLDIEGLSKVKFSDDRYSLMIEDPLNKLPLNE